MSSQYAFVNKRIPVARQSETGIQSLASFCLFVRHVKGWWRERELHTRPSGYEPDEMLLLYPAKFRIDDWWNWSRGWAVDNILGINQIL
jgi:hypothetical protein